MNEIALNWFKTRVAISKSERFKQFGKVAIAALESQRWISAKERLPEPFVPVLGFMTDAGDFPPVRECYNIGGGEGFYFPALKEMHPVSHWRPMPEPPKGEEE